MLPRVSRSSAPNITPAPEYLFYDGHCGLCHRAVQFVLRHDPSGQSFRFAPLNGITFYQRVGEPQQANLPDSIVVLTADNRLLVRSNAILHILQKLGGNWKGLAGAIAILPRPVRDAAYNLIARIRYAVFGRRGDTCPVVPPEWRDRFAP
jgi:predicted DCC family thiol-disulfide oxidoreductase YuxK